MRKYILLFLLIPVVAYASGAMKLDAMKKPFPAIAPTVFGIFSTTKAAKTFTVSTYARVRVQPSAAVTVKVDGAGVAWPIAANAIQDYCVPSDNTSLVFYVTSSASTAKTKVYWQAE